MMACCLRCLLLSLGLMEGRVVWRCRGGHDDDMAVEGRRRGGGRGSRKLKGSRASSDTPSLSLSLESQWGDMLLSPEPSPPYLTITTTGEEEGSAMDPTIPLYVSWRISCSTTFLIPIPACTRLFFFNACEDLRVLATVA